MPSRWGTFTYQNDRVMDEALFLKICESVDPYVVEVHSEPSTERNHPPVVYRARFVKDGRNAWKSAPKPTADAAERYAKEFMTHRRWLAHRRLAGKADPDVQLAYGVGTR